MNFFAPVALARGLIKELSAAHGAVVNVTSIAGSRVHPFAGSAYATSKAALAALTRDADCRHSDAAARTARGGGQGHLYPVHRAIEQYQRRRAFHRWGPASVTRPSW